MRLKGFIVGIGVSGVVLGLSQAPALAAPDANPPVLTALRIVGGTAGTPYAVNTTAGASEVGVTVHFTDVGDGVQTVDVTASCVTACAGPAGSQTTLTGSDFSFNGSGFAGGSHNGATTVVVDVPATAQTGTWQISKVVVSDGTNDTTVTDLTGFANRSFAVTRTSDTTGPALASMTFSPSAPDVTLTDQAVVADLHLTDTTPGVDSGTVTITNGTDIRQLSFTRDAISTGNFHNGHWLTDPQLFTNFDAGDWHVSAISIKDGFGNATTAVPGGLPHLVVANTTDTAAPVVTSFSAVPSNVNATTGDTAVTITVHITDGNGTNAQGSGVTSLVGDFHDASFNQISFFVDSSNLVSGTARDGTYVTTAFVAARQPAGDYALADISANDRQNNPLELHTADNPNVFDGAPWNAPFVTVTTGDDSVAGPQVTSLVMGPQTLNLSNGFGFRSVDAFLTVTDDVSGFDHADVNFTGPDSNPYTQGEAFTSFQRSAGSPTNGTYLGLLSPPANLTGTWSIASIDVFDLAGNKTTITKSQLTSAGFPSSFSVVNQTGDVNGPVLTGMTLDAAANTATGDAVAHGTMSVTDPGTGGVPATGFAFGDITLTSPTGKTVDAFVDSSAIQSGNDTNGTYSFTARIPQWAENGSWQVTSVELDDNWQGVSRYSGSLLNGALGGTRTVTVSGPVDNVLPTLTGFTGVTPTVDTNDANPTATFNLHLVDPHATPASGISDAEVDLTSPNGVDFGSGFTANLVSGTPLDGIWQVQVRLAQFDQPGTWTAAVFVDDLVGNRAHYTAGDLQTAGFTSTQAVTGPVDSTQPDAPTLTFEPTSVDSSGGATFALVDAHFTDNAVSNDGSGVTTATLRLASPHGSQSDIVVGFHLVGGTPQDGWWQSSFPVPQFVDSGDWTVKELKLTDARGNVLDVTPATIGGHAGVTPFVHIQGVSDTTAPTVTGLALPAIDVSAASKNENVDLHLLDDLSGVASVTLDLVSPSGTHSAHGSLGAPTTGTRTDGHWVVPVAIDRFTEPGTWKLDNLRLIDTFGNAVLLRTTNLSDQGLTPTFTVTSTPDTQGPALLSLSFTPSSPDVSTGQVPVSFTAHISDGDGAGHAGSGFTLGDLTLTSPNGQRVAFGDLDGTPAPGGSATDGTFTGSVVIPQYAQPGTWNVTGVSLFDDNGNQQSYTNATLPATGVAKTLSVVDANPDLTPPAVTGVAITPATVNVSTGAQVLTLDVHATDAASGVVGGSYVLTGPAPDHQTLSGDFGSLTSGTPKDGHWVIHQQIGTQTESGTWTVSELHVSDAADNIKTYLPSNGGVPATNTFTVTGTQVTPPTAPLNLSGQPGNGSVTLHWTEPTNHGGAPLTGYDVLVSPHRAGQTDPDVVHFDASQTTRTVPGLTNGTPYTFQVRALNGAAAGPGPYTSATAPITPAPQKPDTPGQPNATAGNQQATVTWAAPADNGATITQYDVTVSPARSGHTAPDVVHVSGPTAGAVAPTTTTVTGLTNGTSYTFQVVAINSVGSSAPSLASVGVIPAVAPVTDLTLTPAVDATGHLMITATWTLPANDAGAHVCYTVNTAGAGNEGCQGDNIPSGSPQQQVFTGSLVAPGAPYAVTVFGYDDAATRHFASPQIAGLKGTSVTIGKNATISYGKSATISGTLRDMTTSGTPVLAGQSVELWKRASSTTAWAKVTTVTTTASGVASSVQKPTANTQYQYRYQGVNATAGSLGGGAAVSAVQSVLVAQTVAVTQTVTKIRHGKVVKFYGTVAPAATNQVVYLDQKVGTKWKRLTVKATIKKQKLPNGKTVVGYVLSYTPAKAGTFTFRVERPATSKNAVGYSKTLTLKAT